MIAEFQSNFPGFRYYGGVDMKRHMTHSSDNGTQKPHEIIITATDIIRTATPLERGRA